MDWQSQANPRCFHPVVSPLTGKRQGLIPCVLGTWVRERTVLSLPEAIRRLTPDPADMFGIRDRGRLKPGLAANIAIFDPATVGSSNRGERRYDLLGGGKRMVMPSRGVRTTIVNGVTTYADGELVGASAGRVLRS